jgi:predicted dehydrogenase
VLLTYPQAIPAVFEKPPKAVPVIAALSATRSADIVRLGVLGAGNFASAVMLPALRKNPKVELIGVVSGSGMSAQHIAHKFKFHYAGSSAEQVMADPQVNTIAILTRHHLHAAQVLAGLAARKHIFCEKPLALNEAELTAIAEALQGFADLGEPAPLLMVGFNRRFAPLAVELAAFISERKEPLVAHYRVNAGYIPSNHWVHDPIQGGGRIIGEGCHFIDFLTFLVGQPPASVHGFTLPDAGRYQGDNAVLSFTFPDGSVGTISYLANGDKAFSKERLEVFTGGRVAVLDDFRSLEMINNVKRTRRSTPLRQDKGHRAEWEAFAAVITSGGLPPIPYKDIFGVTRASFAAVESLRTGETVKIFSGE